MRPVGFEPTLTWVKARDAAVTPRPHCWSGVSVSIAEQMTSCCSCWFGCEVQVVVLGIELSAAVLSEPLGRPALDYRSQVGHLGVEPRPSCSQSRRATICTSARLSFQSERQDLNLRSPGPRPGAITRLRHVLIVSGPCGSRTQPARLERPMTSAVVDRAVLRAYTQRKWTRGRSNPRLLGFNQALNRLSYRSVFW